MPPAGYQPRLHDRYRSRSRSAFSKRTAHFAIRGRQQIARALADVWDGTQGWLEKRLSLLRRTGS
jgi:hypothetical protein